MKKVMVHIPHSSLNIPKEYLPVFSIDPAEIRRQQLLLTDHYTNEFAPKGEDVLIFPLSRLLCDVERFREKQAECMTEKGMWVCYTNGAEKQLIKQVTPEHEAEILQKFYNPHHRVFAQMVHRRVAAFGKCMIVDLHSFPPQALPYETDRTALRPDICIGTDSFHTPNELAADTQSFFEAAGLRVACNTPFGGTITPLEDYGRTGQVLSIMIEVNRALYMKTNSFEKSANFPLVQRILRKYLLFLEQRDF